MRRLVVACLALGMGACGVGGGGTTVLDAAPGGGSHDGGGHQGAQDGGFGPDRDGDGVLDPQDDCPTVADHDQADRDDDGVGDACDNCPDAPNHGQADADGDGRGDACSGGAGGAGGSAGGAGGSAGGAGGSGGGAGGSGGGAGGSGGGAGGSAGGAGGQAGGAGGSAGGTGGQAGGAGGSGGGAGGQAGGAGGQAGGAGGGAGGSGGSAGGSGGMTGGTGGDVGGSGGAGGGAAPVCPGRVLDASGGCPVTIYEARDSGATPRGTRVTVEGVVTAARGPALGFFVLQVPTGDAGYAGPDRSGIWVFTINSDVAVAFPQPGQRLRVTGDVDDYFGQRQIGHIHAVEPSGQADLPAPVVVRAADVATGGPRADALEGVLVEVRNVAAADLQPAVGPGDMAPTYEFVVDGGLRVNDFLYRVDPFPQVGERFTRIAGVLRHGNGDSKIEPRSVDDVGRQPVPPPAMHMTLTAPPTVGVGRFFPAYVSLDFLAPPGGLPVTITADPPDAVVAGDFAVSGGAQRLRAVLTAGAAAGPVTLTATSPGLPGQIGRVQVTLVDPLPPGQLLINEVDYDQAGDDFADFVEILNPGDRAVALAPYRLELHNGSAGGDDVYGTVELGAAGPSLAPHGRMVVGMPGALLALPEGVLSLPLPAAGLQNGGNDGVLLVKPATGEVVDAMTYEGDIPGLTEDTSPMMHDEAMHVAGSIQRCPDGSDTNFNSFDFQYREPATPGASNACP